MKREMLPPLLVVFALSGGLPAGSGEIEGALPVSRLDLSEWVGVWRSEDRRFLTVSMPDHHALHVDGLATEADGSEIGVFAEIRPGWISVDNRVSVVVGPAGTMLAEAAGAEDCVIHFRLNWNINWIDAEDNGRCGGRFTGRYEWHVVRGSGGD
ncbi:MAG: hypothetical protein ABS76_10940 [Pelagibacterium sp. SCN 64-44]|nr:MAG: hypothetical protein ABS76_10940 [Pelagibacterium sp. SCN 64-44]